MYNVRTVAVVSEIDHGDHAVDGITFRIKELVWTDGGRTFEVWKGDVDLTFDGGFDAFPTDQDIRRLVNGRHDVTITDRCVIRPNPHPIGRKEQPCEIRVGPYPTVNDMDASYAAPLFMDDVRKLRDALNKILNE